MEQRIIKIENSELTARLFGSFDINTRMIEKAFSVSIRNRSGEEGDADAVGGESADQVRLAAAASAYLTRRAR